MTKGLTTREEMELTALCRQYKVSEQVIKFRVRDLLANKIPYIDILKYLKAEVQGVTIYPLKEYNTKCIPKAYVFYADAFYTDFKALAKHRGIRPSDIQKYKQQGKTLEASIQLAERDAKRYTGKKEQQITPENQTTKQATEIVKVNKPIKEEIKHKVSKVEQTTNIPTELSNMIKQFNLDERLIILDSAVLAMPIDSYLKVICMSGAYKMYERFKGGAVDYRGVKYPSMIHLLVDYGQQVNYARPYIVIQHSVETYLDNLSILNRETAGNYIEYNGKRYETLTRLAEAYKVKHTDLIEHVVQKKSIEDFMAKESREHKQYQDAMTNLCNTYGLDYNKIKEYTEYKGYDTEDYVQHEINLRKGKCIFTDNDRHVRYFDGSKIVRYNGLVFQSMQTACKLLGLDEVQVQFYLKKNINFGEIVSKLMEEQTKGLETPVLYSKINTTSFEKAGITPTSNRTSVTTILDDRVYNTKIFVNDATIMNKTVADFKVLVESIGLMDLYKKEEYRKPFLYKSTRYTSIEEFCKEENLGLVELRLRWITLRDLNLAVEEARKVKENFSREILYKGKTYPSRRSLALELDLNYDYVRNAYTVSQLSTTKETFDELIEELIRNTRDNFITVNNKRIPLKTAENEYKSVTHLCSVEKITYQRLRKELLEGYGLEEAIQRSRK